MKKDSAIITIFSLIFVIVLIVTVVLAVKYPSKNTAEDLSSQPTNMPTTDTSLKQVEPTPSVLNFKIEVDHVPGNDFADIYLTNSQNLAAIEFVLTLPEGVKVINLSDKDLFYDFIEKQEGNNLKIGALSLQVVSPKEKYKILRVFFDKNITEPLTVTNQIFIDQQSNEIQITN